ncbi:competence protein ComEA [Streptomyces sp. AmelKG-E11A]|nr:competence protein ComEA [Streptomyces sp. AmelKG-E11A]
MRRRADASFAEYGRRGPGPGERYGPLRDGVSRHGAVERGPSGRGPLGYGPLGGGSSRPGPEGPGPGGRESGGRLPPGPDAELSRGARAVLAVRERLPLWLRTRCGLERRSLVALTVVLVIAVGFAVQHFWAGRPQPVRAPELVRAAPPGPTAPARLAGPRVVVDVGGKVRDPGLQRLPAGSRVADALGAAGGVKPGTDLTGLNRARMLVDGEQIVVGARPEGPGTVTGAGSVAGSPAGPVTGAGPSAGGAPGSPPLSLSSATAAQLDTLPGVGPVLAQRIVDHRAQQGGFRTVAQLREVTGIGDRRFATLKDLVRP